MPTIPDLAPTLIAAGLTTKEIKHALRPKNPAPPPVAPAIAPKRFRMVYLNLLSGKSVEESAALACVPVAVATAVKAEMDAVKAKLAGLAPIDYNAPPEEDPPADGGTTGG